MRGTIKKYLRYVQFKELSPFPITEELLERFVATLTLSMKSPQSICNMISQLKMIHVLIDVSTHAFERPKVKYLLKGLDHYLKHTVQPSLPLTPQLL